VDNSNRSPCIATAGRRPIRDVPESDATWPTCLVESPRQGCGSPTADRVSRPVARSANNRLGGLDSNTPFGYLPSTRFVAPGKEDRKVEPEEHTGDGLTDVGHRDASAGASSTNRTGRTTRRVMDGPRPTSVPGVWSQPAPPSSSPRRCSPRHRATRHLRRCRSAHASGHRRKNTRPT
jgi:hypothetical protein